MSLEYDLYEMHAELCSAQDTGDVEALADAAWRLYGELGIAHAAAREAEAALAELVAAARSAISAVERGAPEPFALLRHLMSGSSWMPLPGSALGRLLAKHALYHNKLHLRLIDPPAFRPAGGAGRV